MLTDADAPLLRAVSGGVDPAARARHNLECGQRPVDWLKSYFERWLNGLVYELFFPDDLHARKLKLFDETARLNLPDLAAVPEGQKLARLQELHAAANKSVLPAMLADLRMLEAVRIIEEVGGNSASVETNGEEDIAK